MTTDPPSSNTSGCEIGDFAGFPAGGIALIQRGTCGFTVKVLNAQAAGAAGAVIMNEGQPGRDGLINMIGDASGPHDPGGLRDVRDGRRTLRRRPARR